MITHVSPSGLISGRSDSFPVGGGSSAEPLKNFGGGSHSPSFVPADIFGDETISCPGVALVVALLVEDDPRRRRCEIVILLN